jgi:antitoxin component HigA of HigAB toxin-antitoxin module
MDAKYMELISSCPLLPITSKAAHSAAKKMIVELTKRDGNLSKAEIGYGKVLVQLIQAYERQLGGDFFKNVSGGEALEYLLNEHQLKQIEAAEIAGISKQNLNDFLKGRRTLTKEARLRLAKHFKVNSDVFELEKKLASA